MQSAYRGAQFVRSSYCDPDNCVEIARPSSGPVGVKDSKDGPQGPVLEFSRDAWKAFTEFAKEFEV